MTAVGLVWDGFGMLFGTCFRHMGQGRLKSKFCLTLETCERFESSPLHAFILGWHILISWVFDQHGDERWCASLHVSNFCVMLFLNRNPLTQEGRWRWGIRSLTHVAGSSPRGWWTSGSSMNKPRSSMTSSKLDLPNP